MEILRDVLVYFHFIGLAALFGGLFVQVKSDPRLVNNAMFHGILTQLVTGILLVGLLEADADADVNNAKIGVKLVVAVVIAVLVIANRKKRSLSNALYFGMLALAALEIGVAVFWH